MWQKQLKNWASFVLDTKYNSIRRGWDQFTDTNYSNSREPSTGSVSTTSVAAKSEFKLWSPNASFLMCFMFSKSTASFCQHLRLSIKYIKEPCFMKPLYNLFFHLEFTASTSVLTLSDFDLLTLWYDIENRMLTNLTEEKFKKLFTVAMSQLIVAVSWSTRQPKIIYHFKFAAVFLLFFLK